MKTRLLALLLVLCLLAVPAFLVSCQNTPETPDDNNGTNNADPQPDPDPEPERDPLKNLAPASLDVNGDGAVKILSLGNSFSVNTYKFLHPILTAHGIENVTLGNLYSPSCNLGTTAGYVQGNGVYASYYKYDTEGVRTETKNYSAQTAIAEEDWDIITLQQASGFSGRSDSFFPYLDYIIQYIEENRTVKDGLLMWHMTWAYQQTHTSDAFINYYNADQMTMYKAIVNTTKEKVLTDEAFSMVIPAGTAIQNARTSFLGDSMTTDGYHLN
ncbi:MAG: DUF4886 domain-containing protein, partial [Clostridia bacterium]|nr:DUF4886 domain-containing protein [Clostridia bacterium]